MSPLTIPKADDRRYDVVALGEVMLRLDPGEGRIRAARNFQVWEGGGEYNVARGLNRCFGLRAAALTALPDNDVGRLAEGLMLAGGVDVSHVVFRPFDGVGRSARMGLNFTERGFGLRAPRGVSDRAGSAASALAPDDVDWDALFQRDGTRWLHTGGIFAALSDACAETARLAMTRARAAGAVVSYDLNYRPSLWEQFGGSRRARRVNAQLVRLADVLLGNEEDYVRALGVESAGVNADFRALDADAYGRMLQRVAAEYPNLSIAAATLRVAHSATRNDWGAVLLADGALHEAPWRRDVEILDRVGGGDSFASGLIYALLAGKPPAEAVRYGAAHGALAMTTPGDASMATLDEVEQLLRGGNARIER